MLFWHWLYCKYSSVLILIIRTEASTTVAYARMPHCKFLPLWLPTILSFLIKIKFSWNLYENLEYARTCIPPCVKTTSNSCFGSSFFFLAMSACSSIKPEKVFSSNKSFKEKVEFQHRKEREKVFLFVYVRKLRAVMTEKTNVGKKGFCALSRGRWMLPRTSGSFRYATCCI